MIPNDFRSRLRQWCVYSGILVLLFSPTLVCLVRYCLKEDLFSYVLLVPAICAWLVWQDLGRLGYEFCPGKMGAAVWGILSLTMLLSSFFVDSSTPTGETNGLCLRTLAFVLGFNAVNMWTLGAVMLRKLSFPAGFLIFLVPLPPHWVKLFEVGLQHASATVAGWFFAMTGASYLQAGLVFSLPNITIQVAPECSGIRSTLVLFMTSLIAGHLFLDKKWQRITFALLIIPLGIARNGFRILTLGWLCTEYGPQMIDTWIHHRGGPVFFALSLIPLFGLLFLFRWMNGRRPGKAGPEGPPPDNRRVATAAP